MCFGNTETGQKDTSSTPNPAVASAAESNIGFAQNLQSGGFQPYTGQMVANFSPQQSSSFGMADTIGASPNFGTAQNDINSAASAPASSVSANTIASQMSPYMNQYVQQSLAPQLQNLQQQFDTQNKGAQANATMAGAFGNDSQDALYRSNLTQQQDTAQTGLVGQAYNAAFNTAIGAGAQDVSNNLNAQTTNANLNETALQRQMQGATGLENLATSQEGAANLVNQFGQQQTAQAQAGDNANYQQYQNAQQYPFLTTELLNQTVGAGAQAMPASTTTTTSAPNNSGYALAGAALPFALGFADGGDPPVGQSSVVGETGPELAVSGMTPAVGGQTVSAAAPMQMPTLPSLGGQQPGQQPQTQQQQTAAANANTPIGQMMSGFNTGNTLMNQSGGGFGGGAGAGGDSSAGDFSSFGSSMGGLAFATGGSPPVGRPSIVGERGEEAAIPSGRGEEVPLDGLAQSIGGEIVGKNGPEIINPQQPVTIIPHHELQKLAQRYAGKKGKPVDPLAEQMGMAA